MKRNFFGLCCTTLMVLVSQNTIFAFQEKNTGYQNIHPVWNADGSKIMFDSDRTGNWEIYIMNADGSNVQQITNDPGHDGMPSFTADGNNIVFLYGGLEKDGAWKKAEMFIMNIDGSNRRKITDDKIVPGGMYSWSYDKSRIFYLRKIGENTQEAYSMRPDGSGKQKVGNRLPDELLIWSPDGSGALFSSKKAGNGDIFFISANGTGEVNLTNHAGHDAAPEWSPDGSRFAFQSKRGEKYSIYTMYTDGTNLKQLTDDASFDLVPKWHPNWQTIVFESDRESPTGGMNICVINADGAGFKRLTSNTKK